MDSGWTQRWGDDDVPLLERDWVGVRIDGYRKTYALRPGQAWRDAPVSADQYQHLVLQDDEPVPVRVAIARELMASGCRLGLLH
jgi:hypothetical protein